MIHGDCTGSHRRSMYYPSFRQPGTEASCRQGQPRGQQAIQDIRGLLSQYIAAFFASSAMSDSMSPESSSRSRHFRHIRNGSLAPQFVSVPSLASASCFSAASTNWQSSSAVIRISLRSFGTSVSSLATSLFGVRRHRGRHSPGQAGFARPLVVRNSWKFD
jgi:hypothetical protein